MTPVLALNYWEMPETLPFSGKDSVPPAPYCMMIMDWEATSSNLSKSFLFDLGLDQARRKINALVELPPNWNGYNAAVPNEMARHAAITGLNALYAECSVLPERISPTGDSGIMFNFESNGRHFVCEFFPDGEAGIVETGVGGKTILHDITAGQIAEHLRNVLRGG